MKRHYGRTLALILLGLFALGAALLRTEWAGEKVCDAARKRLPALLGMEVMIGSCSIDPLRGGVELKGFSVRPKGDEEPLFAADRLLARLRTFELLSQTLRLERVDVEHARVRVDVDKLHLKSSGGSGCFLAKLKSLEVDALAVNGAQVQVILPGGRTVDLEEADVDLRMSPSAYVARVSVPKGRVKTGNVELPLSRLRLSAAIDPQREKLTVNHLEVAAGELALFVRGDVENLCDPSLLLEGTLYLPLDVVSAALGPQAPAMSGTAAVNLKKIEGSPRDPSLEVEVTLAKAQVQGFDIGDVFLEARLEKGKVAIDKLDLSVGEGKVRVKGTLGLRENMPLLASVEFEDLGFGRLLDKLTLHHAWVDYSATGRAEVKGQVLPFHVNGPAAVEVRDLHVFSSGWDRPDHFHVLDLDPAHVDLTLDINTERVRLYRAKVKTERGTDLDVDTTLNFNTKKGLEIVAKINALELADLKHIVGIPWEGHVVGGHMRLTGPYGEPRIDGQASLRDFRFQKVSMNSAEALVKVEDFVLKFPEVKAIKGTSRFNLEGEFDLRGGPPKVRATGNFENARLSDLLDAIGDEHWVFDPLRGKADAKISGRASIVGPVMAARALVEVKVEDFTWLDRKFGDGTIVFRAEDGERVMLDPVELEGPSGKLHFAGKVELDKYIDFTLDAPVLYPEELAKPTGEFLGLRGALSARVHFFGPTDHLQAEGTVQAKSIGAFGVGLGDGTWALTMDRVTMSLKGPLGRDLLLDGRVVFAGDLPYALGVSANTTDLGHYFPGIVGLKGSLVGGEAMSTGTLVHVEESRGDISVARVEVGKGDWSLTNDGPLAFAFQGGFVEIKKAAIKGTAGTRLTAVGRLEDGELDVAVDGSFDAPIFELITPWARETAGKFTVSAKISGPAGHPDVIGNARLENGRFKVVGLPTAVSASEVRGSVDFSQNKLFLSEVDGTVNSGPVHVHGEMELKDLALHRLDLQADLDQVHFKWPETVPTTFSGILRIYGPITNLEVQGDVNLDRLRYSEEIDLYSFLNNAKRRRLDARSFEKRDEWLRYNVNVHVPSGGARIENNLLTLTLKGDLMLVGTNVHTGLVGDLDTEEGGLGHFQGNEFRIDRGELHFGERDRIAVTIDAHAETQVREFRVQLHAFGPYEDPQVMLTSDPELGRADLVALLTIGATAREQGAYTSTAGASLAGELLMGATGLDRQLKAFLPKNAIIRDLNVNMATQLSDVSGIVEPTAQVEAKIYSDKMKVRFSQPMISGKGRRLQLELRIDDHTYLQGQWDEDPTAPSSGDLGLDLKLRWEFQ